MPIDALSILLLFGFTIIIGYIGSLIFDKTRIPDIIWLLLFGLLLGPVFNLVDVGLFLSVSPFLAAIALLLILFDAGLNLEFYQMVRGFSRSVLLAVVNIIFSIIVVGIVANVLLGLDLGTGMLLGAIIGGTSSPIVLSIMDRLKVRTNIKTMLNLESIITDPLTIVVSLAILNLIIPGQEYSPLQGVLGSFSIGAVVGIISGLVWLNVLDRLKGKPFDYMLTLAALFLMYVLVETASGSGAIAALCFGLVLGNGRTFSRMLRIKAHEGADPLLKTFQNEISFFIRSFFFVFLGIIVSINPALLGYGLVIAATVILLRIAATKVAMLKMSTTRYERNVIRGMAPRGLAAAVLAQFPVAYGIPGGEIFSDIIFIVIIATVVYSAVVIRIVHPKADLPTRKLEKEVKKATSEVKAISEKVKKQDIRTDKSAQKQVVDDKKKEAQKLKKLQKEIKKAEKNVKK